MMSELLIQIDEHDTIIGPVERLKAHLDDGILHRGLMVIVKDNEDKVLLTQRSTERPDLTWAFPHPSQASGT